jgi:hypothetical protein
VNARRDHLRQVRDAVLLALAAGPLSFPAIRAVVEPSVPGCSHEDVRVVVGYLRKLGRIAPADGAWRLRACG